MPDKISDKMSDKKRKTVWVTRTQPGADATAKKLTALGFTPIIAPLLHISPPEDMPIPPVSDDVLIFTSKNALHAFRDLTDRRHWPVITVGDGTAEIARQIGFQDVRSAAGTSTDIIRFIQSNYGYDRHFYHAAGNHVRGAIIETLREKGYKAERQTLYISTPTLQNAEFHPSQVDFILLFSPLAAYTLAQMNINLHKAHLISMSQAVNGEIKGIICRGHSIAKYPTETSMIAEVLSLREIG